MTKFEEKPIATVKMIPTSDGNEIKFKTSSDLGSYLISKGEADLYLKSQLQQQALPVVPECVGGYIEECKGNLSLYGALFHIFDNTNKELNNWVFREANQDLFARAWLDGYTVEKQQLFYLRDELTGQFLAKNNQFKDKDRYFFWTGEDPLTHSIGTAWKLSFTQQEIDSMQTGSYEQIEVEK